MLKQSETLAAIPTHNIAKVYIYKKVPTQKDRQINNILVRYLGNRCMEIEIVNSEYLVKDLKFTK